MIRAIRPSAMAQDDASLISGWNVAPNVGYTVVLTPGSSACGVLLFDADMQALIASGAGLVGTEQPVVLLPQTGQTIGMVDADLGWHLLLTTTGAEAQQNIRIGPAVDLPDEIHPVYTDDSMALARATAAINSGASYVDDVGVTCPLGLGAGIGGVVSAPVDGTAVVGQVESVTWSGSPAGTSETAVVRRHTQIAPESYVAPATPPTLADDTAETDAATTTSGNVLTNDTGTLTVSAVNGLSVNVGEEIAGSNGGEFVINADGAWTFDPSGDFAALSGSDTATTSVAYHASNGSAEASATLTVTVSAVAGALWTPAAITTALWLDAADSGTITLSGSVPIAMLDKSGLSRNATGNTTGSYLVADQNGQNVIELDNSVFTVEIAQSAGDVSFFIACSPQTASGTGRYFLDIQLGRLIFAQIAWTGSMNRVGFFDGTWRAFGYATTGPQILGFVLSTTGASVYRNDIVIGTSSYTQRSIGGVVRLFKHYTEDSAFADGEFFESLLIARAVSTDERQKITGYLAHRWGMATDLLADHPYKSAPPML